VRAVRQAGRPLLRALYVSGRTVDDYRTQLRERLGIHDLAGLVRYAVRVGLVSAKE
jgi:DNA-binding NarL/FixJ family response regulator